MKIDCNRQNRSKLKQNNKCRMKELNRKKNQMNYYYHNKKNNKF